MTVHQAMRGMLTAGIETEEPEPRQRRWDRTETGMRTCSCRLRAAEYHALQYLARDQNMTVHEIVRTLVGAYLANNYVLPDDSTIWQSFERITKPGMRQLMMMFTRDNW